MCKNLWWAKKILLPDGKHKIQFITPVKEAPYEFTQSGLGWSYVKIPCGKCLECRLNYAKEWANRGTLEAQKYTDNQYLTLTYDEKYLPKNTGIDIKTGELTEVPTLKKEDLVKFNKDLRRYYEYHYNMKNLKYLQCGEYGQERDRPHYHQIMYNLPVPDKKFWYTNKRGFPVYRSELLDKIWGKGIVTIGDVVYDSISYVARYILKKQKGAGAKEFYKDIGRVEEFFSASKGIGKDYALKHIEDIYNYDEIWIKKKDKVYRTRPPRYFDKLFDKLNHEGYIELKKKREQIAEQDLSNQLKMTDLSYKEYLDVKEFNKEAKLKSLYKRHYEESGN